jgi:hypothetical protein
MRSLLETPTQIKRGLLKAIWSKGHEEQAKTQETSRI